MLQSPMQTLNFLRKEREREIERGEGGGYEEKEKGRWRTGGSMTRWRSVIVSTGTKEER